MKVMKAPPANMLWVGNPGCVILGRGGDSAKTATQKQCRWLVKLIFKLILSTIMLG